jgi:hypothetical protein
MGRIAWVTIGLLVVPGCGDHVCNVLCPVSGRLEVDVINDQTGAQICDATVTATDGAYVEQLQLVPGGCRYAQSQCCLAGTYSVRVERAGFQPKVVRNVEIRVLRGDCCEITEGALVEIRLSPTP